MADLAGEVVERGGASTLSRCGQMEDGKSLI